MSTLSSCIGETDQEREQCLTSQSVPDLSPTVPEIKPTYNPHTTSLRMSHYTGESPKAHRTCTTGKRGTQPKGWGKPRLRHDRFFDQKYEPKTRSCNQILYGVG
jgi:hypothetical protein